MTERVTHVNLRWTGGGHRFDLGVDRWAEGDPRGMHDRVRAVLGRLMDGQWGVEDIVRPITCGLAYGGSLTPRPLVGVDRMMAEMEGGRWGSGPARRPAIGDTWTPAVALVDEHVRSRPLGDHVDLAQTILIAAILGVPKAQADQMQDLAAYAEAEA